MQEWSSLPRGNEFPQRHCWGQAPIVLIPDRIGARLIEAEWTCALAAAGVEVFGQNPGDLCPAKAWLDERRSGWGANWQNPRTPTLCLDADGIAKVEFVAA